MGSARLERCGRTTIRRGISFNFVRLILVLNMVMMIIWMMMIMIFFMKILCMRLNR